MQEPIQPVTGGKLTYEDFLEFVKDKEGEYEYVDGRAVALASPSPEHDRLVSVLNYLIYGHVRGSGCIVYLSHDLETVPGEEPRRPDLAVTCDKRDAKRGLDRPHAIHFPKLLIEVLSPKTRDDDLGDKLNEYKALPSVEEYLIVDSTRHWIRRHYRNADKNLVFDADQISGTVGLASIGYTLDIDALYTEANV
jgi:Uma2 family endonuclease